MHQQQVFLLLHACVDVFERFFVRRGIACQVRGRFQLFIIVIIEVVV
jgi:hypothetical protein